MALTDLFNLSNPQAMGLLGFANAMGQAAMPHRMPVSLGAALGAGAGGFAGGYTQGLQNQKQQMQNQFMKARMNMLQQLTGGTPTTMPTQQPYLGLSYNQAAQDAQTNPQMFSAPAPAGLLSQTPSQPTNYFNPMKLYQQGHMLALMGLPGGASMMSAALSHDPSVAGQVALAQKGMTRGPNGQVSYLPGFVSSQAQLSGAQEQAKFPYEAASSFLRYAGRPTVLSPGQKAVPGLAMLPLPAQRVITNAITGKPQGTQTPAAPIGQQGAPAVQTAPYQAPQPPAETPIASSDTTPNTAGTINTAAGPVPVMTGMSPFQKEAQTAHASQLEKESEALRNAADNAVTTNYNLDQMSQALSGFKPGPGTNLQMWLEHNAAILGKPFGIEPPKNLGSYQEFQKYANQVAFAATRQMGAREAAQVVEMQIKSNPNAELNPEAVHGLINSMHAMNDYIIAKSRAEQNWRQSHAGSNVGFNQNWQKEYDPRAWEFPNMSPEAQQNFVSHLTPKQAKQFMGQLHNAYAAGYVQ